jgi:hypothetical protein
MSHNEEHAANIAALHARPDFAPGLGAETAAVAVEGDHAAYEQHLQAINSGTDREATEIAARRSREHAARLAAVHAERERQQAAEDHAEALALEAAERDRQLQQPDYAAPLAAEAERQRLEADQKAEI